MLADDTPSSYNLAQNRELTVDVVHHDLVLCETASVALRIEGYQTRFSSGVDMFESSLKKALPNAVILGEAMIDLLYRIRALQRGIAVIVVQNDAQLDRALRAIQEGADDVIAVPLDIERLLRGVRQAIVRRGRSGERMTIRSTRFDSLTQRESQVLDLVLAGSNNKEVGSLLNISPRTVEVHRARIMRKVGAKNAVDLALKAAR